MTDELESALAELDARIEARGAVWLGSEPTFTDASSFDAEWSSEALGPTKERRARELVAAYVRRRPNVLITRSLGRQYAGESLPRWSYGIWERRDRKPVWRGPSDPIISSVSPPRVEVAAELAEAARDALAQELAGEGFGVAVFEGQGDHRIAARRDGAMADPFDARLLQPSLHSRKLPDQGAIDELAAEGLWLFRISVEPLPSEGASGTRGCVRIELPDLGDAGRFAHVLALVAHSVEPLSLPALIIAGFPPPFDASYAFTTVTPDPAVIEVNMAPCTSTVAFLEESRIWHEAARAVGLSPRRFFYDGDVGDSGGGGQMTIGGPSPRQSPFFVEPRLLPRLVSYLSAHPALSYLFAIDNVGPFSQSPRADEGTRSSARELDIALRRLAQRERDIDAELLHESLAPFLVDPSGNSHRAEINVEKLWSTAQPRRGMLGLVELRAFRMARTPERAAAIGALLRALIAHLMSGEHAIGLRHWGDALHDRWALPSVLLDDLRGVLGDLRRGGYGLGDVIERELLDGSEREVGSAELGGARLTVRKAIEIWPLLGDASSQEQRASRLIDSSTRRIEIRIDDPSGEREHRIAHAGMRVPLAPGPEGCRLGAIRYRAFAPRRGLHPGVGPHVPIVLRWWVGEEGVEITLHDWKPGGGAYEGLPTSDREAARRRAERFVVVPLDDGERGEDLAEGAVFGMTLDRMVR